MFVDTIQNVSFMVDELCHLPSSPPSIYIDLEGVKLSRHGTISIMQIYNRTIDKTYLVDVRVLGSMAFRTLGYQNSVTLQYILESPVIPKVFFDVRRDSDALYAHYRVALQCIQDLQLMEYACRRHPKNRLLGLQKCIQMDLTMGLVEKENWLQTKEEGIRLFAPEHGGSYEVFNIRPLPEKIRLYCEQDVRYLHRLWDEYDRKLSPLMRARVNAVSQERVAESQDPDFTDTGKQMALPPAAWIGMF